MSYQVIARKWRPQSFDQVVGQDHIAKTLTNALKNNRLHHALLFTGPRGTGKTSSARILAKALRCPNAVDFVPCGVCSECQEIALSRSPNVIEIDGASNNGVDAIRELLDSVMYSPSSGKYKVYIIDEVHMLSTSAFNALLKTLEEPPAHVVFVLATTEVHKIPQTILSRCQRFDFRRIPTRQITEHLQKIVTTDGLEADIDALWMIARQGDGSMRDSQSLLDQVVTFANGALTKEIIVSVLGLTDRTLLLETLSALVARDGAALLPLLTKITLAGYEPHLYANDLLENIRHTLLLKVGTGDQTSQLVDLPDSEIRFLQELGRDVSEEDLHLLFDMCLKGANDIPRASDPKIVLEMLLLRMVNAPRVESLEKFLSSGGTFAAGVANATGPRPAIKAPAPAPASARPESRPPASMRVSSPSAPLAPQEKWFQFVQEIKAKDSLLGAKVEHLVFVGEKDKTLSLSIPATQPFIKTQMEDRATREKLQSFVDQQWGAGYALQINLAQGAPAGTSAKAHEQEKEERKQQTVADQVAAHPKVKAASLIFKGQVKSIKESV